MPARKQSQYGTVDEEAGAIEHYLDPALYDHEYRRRRADLNFYRLLVEERISGGHAGPILELACGSGRLTVPLLRAGHTLIAFDRAPTMLKVARNRVARLPQGRREKALLFRADMRSFGLKTRVSVALAGFHSIQHLIEDADVLACFRNVHASLRSDGWFIFDVLPPHPHWMQEASVPRWSARTFSHPVTKQCLRYGTTHVYDSERKALHMRLHYQAVGEEPEAARPEHIVRLCHRQFLPGDLDQLLDQSGFQVLARYSNFSVDAAESAESLVDARDEHIYIARPKR